MKWQIVALTLFAIDTLCGNVATSENRFSRIPISIPNFDCYNHGKYVCTLPMMIRTLTECLGMETNTWDSNMPFKEPHTLFQIILPSFAKASCGSMPGPNSVVASTDIVKADTNTAPPLRGMDRKAPTCIL